MALPAAQNPPYDDTPHAGKRGGPTGSTQLPSARWETIRTLLSSRAVQEDYCSDIQVASLYDLETPYRGPVVSIGPWIGP